MRQEWTIRIILTVLMTSVLCSVSNVAIKLIVIYCLQSDTYWVVSFCHFLNSSSTYIVVVMGVLYSCGILVWITRRHFPLTRVALSVVVLLPVLVLVGRLRFESIADVENNINRQSKVELHDFMCCTETNDRCISNENIVDIDIDEDGTNSCILSVVISKGGEQLLADMKKNQNNKTISIYIDGKLVTKMPLKDLPLNQPLRFPVEISYKDPKIWNLVKGILWNRTCVN